VGTYRDPLGPLQLWGVRWLTGTFFAVELVFGLIAASLYGFATERFWIAAILSSMIPGFLLGYLVQYKLDAAKLSEHRWTVVLLGLIAVVVSGFAVVRALGGSHAG
jgi:general stress protein CsbA